MATGTCISTVAIPEGDLPEDGSDDQIEADARVARHCARAGRDRHRDGEHQDGDAEHAVLEHHGDHVIEAVTPGRRERRQSRRNPGASHQWEGRKAVPGAQPGHQPTGQSRHARHRREDHHRAAKPWPARP